MGIPSNWITCDGCGLPASSAHVAERLNRLELATRFRPIHINVLFVAAAPLLRPEDDFYGPPESRDFFDPFLEAVEIRVTGSKTHAAVGSPDGDSARLLEFQRRGYYLAYFSECPIATREDAVSSANSRLGPTFIRRVRFNYKPKHIAILGANLSPLLDLFETAGMAAILFPLVEAPNLGEAVLVERFRAALASLVAHDSLDLGYDTIQVKQP